MSDGAGRRFRAGGPLLALAATAATLAVLELALRVAAGGGQGQGLVAAAAPPRGSFVRLGEMLRPSEERRIVYELRPGLDVVFRGATVTTDDRGFRRTGGPPPVGEPRRVVGLGDSLMFGWGVGDRDTYLARLEAALREADASWEVVNTAVPGYNTVMEVETLKRKALALRPQAVVLEVVGNDGSLPNFLRAPRSPTTLRRSFLFDFVAARLRNGRLPEESGLVAAPQVGEGESVRFEDDPAQAPSEYADLVGRDALATALQELARLRDRHGFTVFVVSEATGFDWVQRLSRRRARELGFVYVDVGPVLRGEVSRGGFADYDRSPLVLGRDDPHPSPLGHQLTGRELHRAFVARGLAASR